MEESAPLTRTRGARHVRGLLASLVGTAGQWLHFAWRVGHGRRAEMFGVVLSYSKDGWLIQS